MHFKLFTMLNIPRCGRNYPKPIQVLHTSIAGIVCILSHVALFATPWILACQDPLSVEFPRQEYWSGLPFPPPGGFPDRGFKPVYAALAGRFFTTEPPEIPVLFPY